MGVDSVGSATRWSQDDWDKPLPGEADKAAVNVANAPWARAVDIPSSYETPLPPGIFSNPALAGPAVAFAPPPPPAAPRAPELAAAPNARAGITLANVAKNVATNTHADLTRSFSCGVYRMHPEVTKQADGTDAVVHWVAYNKETRRAEYYVGPSALKDFTQDPKFLESAAANGFMGGDEISAESAKTVDVTQREGVAAGLKQAAHASAVAWSNPDWVAKTVTGATSTFVHSVEVADQLRVQKSAIAAQDVAAGRAPPESFVEHVNKDLPLGKTIGDRRFNCANCSVATDATLGGNPAAALPGNVTSAQNLASHYGTSWSPMMSTVQDVEAAMKQLPPGSRAIIVGAPPGQNAVGHFYNAVNQGGAVRFIDGQIGGVPNTAPFTRFYLLRTN